MNAMGLHGGRKQQSELREKLVYHAREDRRARAFSCIVGQPLIT